MKIACNVTGKPVINECGKTFDKKKGTGKITPCSRAWS